LRSDSPDSVADPRDAAWRSPGSPDPGADARTERLLKSAKHTQIFLAATCVYDCAILFGDWAAGFVDILVPAVTFLLLGLLIGAIRWAHVSRWSLTRRDPSLFLPHQLSAIAVALGIAIAAPQIGFQPLATLLSVGAFSFMAPNTRSLVICWIAAAAGAVGVIFAVGPQLGMPTSTLAGQVLTSAVIVGLLARCIWIAVFVRKLRDRLAVKNDSLRRALARIETLANVDELTGLPNRRAIAETLRQQIALCRRIDLPLTLAFIDIDHFKRINDTFGHAAGDRALKLMASRVAGAVRESDRVGRFGGEEFLLILNATTLRDAGTPLERVRALIANSDWSEVDPSIQVTVTIGAAQYAPGETIEALIRRADLALYLGKENGRNRVVLNSPIERQEEIRHAKSA
jgi:diguanylate cyclase